MFICGFHNGFIIVAFRAPFARHVTQARGSRLDGTYENLLSRL